ncbi:MAG: TetR/AcrR family transcriptional regulator [Acidimicrobiia bacterium]|nr:TetR/AcrR family transcriptional regulator [Acidimicrobiia bacterium]
MPPRRPAADARPATRAPRTRGQQTRERLLVAGATVFADRGFHAARVDDIVKLAATSHGTFYLYFANKEELFRALAEHVAGQLATLAAALPPLTAGPAGGAALTAWLEEFQQVYAGAGPVIQPWTETEIGASDVGKLATVVWSTFTAALVERIRGTGITDLDPAVAALALVAMIERANYYEITGQVERHSSAAPILARITHDALFGTAARA